MTSIRAVLVVALGIGGSGCAREMAAPPLVTGRPTKAAFDAARNRCPVTVVETPAVQQCMRAQGWSYRLPWQ